MAYESISSPGQLGSLEIRNRITLSPMEKNWCDRLGNPGQNYIDYYALRAKHGVGMMNFEATYVDARGRGNLFQLRSSSIQLRFAPAYDRDRCSVIGKRLRHSEANAAVAARHAGDSPREVEHLALSQWKLRFLYLSVIRMVRNSES